MINGISRISEGPVVEVTPEGVLIREQTEAERIIFGEIDRQGARQEILQRTQLLEQQYSICVRAVLEDLDSLTDDDWLHIRDEWQRRDDRTGAPIDVLAYTYRKMIDLYKVAVESEFGELRSELFHWPLWPVAFEIKCPARNAPRAEVCMTPVATWSEATVAVTVTGAPTDSGQEEEYFARTCARLSDLGRPIRFRSIEHYLHILRSRPFESKALDMACDLLREDCQHLFRHLSSDFDIFTRPEIVRRLLPHLFNAPDS